MKLDRHTCMRCAEIVESNDILAIPMVFLQRHLMGNKSFYATWLRAEIWVLVWKISLKLPCNFSISIHLLSWGIPLDEKLAKVNRIFNWLVTMNMIAPILTVDHWLFYQLMWKITPQEVRYQKLFFAPAHGESLLGFICSIRDKNWATLHFFCLINMPKMLIFELTLPWFNRFELLLWCGWDLDVKGAVSSLVNKALIVISNRDIASRGKWITEAIMILLIMNIMIKCYHLEGWRMDMDMNPMAADQVPFTVLMECHPCISIGSATWTYYSSRNGDWIRMGN